MLQSTCRIHVVPEPPINLKLIPRSNLAAILELVMNRNMRKGVVLSISRRLPLRHDLDSQKVKVKKTTGGALFVLSGVLELFGILGNTPLAARWYDATRRMFSDHCTSSSTGPLNSSKIVW